MIGYLCPNKCKVKKTRTELQYEQIQGMRLYKELENEKGKVVKVYEAFCPTCNEYMQVNEKNKKIEPRLY